MVVVEVAVGVRGKYCAEVGLTNDDDNGAEVGLEDEPKLNFEFDAKVGFEVSFDAGVTSIKKSFEFLFSAKFISFKFSSFGLLL